MAIWRKQAFGPMTPPGVNAGARLRAESQQLAQPETTCWVVRRGELVQPNPRLRFGEAADAWLAGQVAELRPATR
jgi:hypothetical protein